jgi:hypothetical protein
MFIRSRAATSALLTLAIGKPSRMALARSNSNVWDSGAALSPNILSSSFENISSTTPAIAVPAELSLTKRLCNRGCSPASTLQNVL